MKKIEIHKYRTNLHDSLYDCIIYILLKYSTYFEDDIHNKLIIQKL